MKYWQKAGILALIALVILTVGGTWLAKSQMPSLKKALAAEEYVPAQEQAKDKILLKAVGDIMLSRKIGTYIDANGVDYPMAQVADYLKDADMTMGNLESPISNNGTPLPGKGIWFRAKPESVEALTAAGFDLLTVANNHALDYESPALLDTLNILKTAGITAIGGGENISQAKKFAICQVGNVNIAVLAYSQMTDIYWDIKHPRKLAATDTLPGINPYNIDTIVADIAEAKKEADIIIVTVHWGIEYANLPEAYQRQDAYAMVDAGANVIIGHHPHVIQGVETYKDGLIAYSLGNFVFDQEHREDARQGLVLELELSPWGWVSASFVPIYIAEGQTTFATGSQQEKTSQLFISISEKLDTKVEKDAGKLVVKGNF